MKSRAAAVVTILCLVALHVSRAAELHSGLSGFSAEFLREYESALKAVGPSKSPEPLLALLEKSTGVSEKAELEVTIGLAYNQWGDMVDPAKTVSHFTAALQYELPEKTQIQILTWRGGSQEQLNRRKEALRDYLRALLFCSYHDLSGGWPKTESVGPWIDLNSSESENVDRIQDYNRYRAAIDRQQFFFTFRYLLVDCIHRVADAAPNGRDGMRKMLGTLSGDSSRFDIVGAWLKSKNKQPWP